MQYILADWSWQYPSCKIVTAIVIHLYISIIWLVVDLPLWKILVMTFPIYGKMKFMFQTTNQWYIIYKTWTEPIMVLKWVRPKEPPGPKSHLLQSSPQKKIMISPSHCWWYIPLQPILYSCLTVKIHTLYIYIYCIYIYCIYIDIDIDIDIDIATPQRDRTVFPGFFHIGDSFPLFFLGFHIFRHFSI